MVEIIKLKLFKVFFLFGFKRLFFFESLVNFVKGLVKIVVVGVFMVVVFWLYWDEVEIMIFVDIGIIFEELWILIL